MLLAVHFLEDNKNMQTLNRKISTYPRYLEISQCQNSVTLSMIFFFLVFELFGIKEVL